MDRYVVRTIDADPTSGPVDFHKAPPEPVHYVYDTVRDQPVPLTSSHDVNAVAEDCADRNRNA